MYSNDIRRHPDGSLDLDFHRRRARRLRERARREFMVAHAEQIAKAVVAAIIIAVSIHLVPARDGTGWNGMRAASAQGYVSVAGAQHR
jgi:protein-S-isoprenylcysteine O-methyltransferase Ste14